MARSAAATAQKAEAQDGSVTFTYDGHTYTVKADALDDVETMAAFEEGKILLVVKTILGPAQWAVFVSKKRTVSKDLSDFTNALFAALGTSTGESQG